MIPQRLPLLAVFTVATVAAVGLLAWWTRGPRQPAGLQFVDPTTGLGLDRVLRCGSPEKFWILENVGSGCALLDANGDGRLDIFLPSPGWVEDNAVTGQGPALYLQLPGGAFEDRTVEAGLTSVTWQTGVAVGDMDNDGNPDLFVSCYGKDQLYRNVGNARFREVSRPMGLTSTGFSSSAVFLDFDRDGYLDLYVAGYVRFKPDLPANGEKPCLQNGVPVACAPGLHEPEPDRLYHNEAGERFVEVSERWGISGTQGGYGLGVAAGDFDGDGWPDIYVANDTTANFLWRNVEGTGFEDVALWTGAALSDWGQGQAGMGVEVADADSDGHVDIFVTNYSHEFNAYYRNLGDGTFEDATHAAGFAAGSYPFLGWGVRLADLDQDGDLDLVAANGHVHPRASEIHANLTYPQRCLFYLNDGHGHFTEQGLHLGDAAATPRCHRGLAVGDLDNDGDLDILLSVIDAGPVVLRNEGSPRGSWVSFRLQGTRSNRDAIGARVTLTAQGRTQFREVTRGGGYLSAQDPRLYFGLHTATQVESLQIKWPSGAVDEIGPLEARKRYRVVEGGKSSELRIEKSE
jgi:hypothetical protein